MASLLTDDRRLQDAPGDRRHQRRDALECRRAWREVVLSHPSRGERHGRKPEQQVHVRPQDRPVHGFHNLKKMVVVVPIDGDVDEAEDVAHEHWPEREQVVKARPVRRLHLKHHDGDDDGEVADGRKAANSAGNEC